MSELRGQRVEKDMGEFWLTWEAATGPEGFLWKWDQRRMTRREVFLWRLFGRVPAVTNDG